MQSSADRDLPRNGMEPIKQKTSALDFFLQLGIIISLYAGVGFLLNLLFRVIDTAFPTSYGYYGMTSSISFPVAALIVLTPVFLLLTATVTKAEATDPEKKTIWIRKTAIYLTMFLSGAIIVGDLIALLYRFLDGQDLTMAFILKVLAVFVVLGALFSYYWSILKSNLSLGTRNAWRVGAILLVLVSIILGFSVIGSPKTQRLMRADQEKIYDLQNIQGQIINYWTAKGTVPATIDDLKDPLAYSPIPLDGETGMPYEYKQNGLNGFELCATFNTSSNNGYVSPETKPMMGQNDNWQYSAGRTCFERTIDPNLYPTKIPRD